MKASAIATVMGVLCVSALAVAGSRSRNEVEIYQYVDGSVSVPGAKGDLIAARFSADAVQFIGCSASAYDTGPLTVHCTARNKAGVVRVCMTTQPEMVRTALALDSAGYVFFTVAADGSSCGRIIPISASFAL